MHLALQLLHLDSQPSQSLITTHCITIKMESLSISDTPRLDTLPDDILLIIISYLTTAQNIARLEATSKRLYQLISSEGWRPFVRNCSHNLSLPPTVASHSADRNIWKELAQRLTSQSRDWDRRGFTFHVFSRQERLARGRNQHANFDHASQTVRCHIILDAHSHHVSGRSEEETLVWGAGEDLVGLTRQKYDGVNRSQVWRRCQGSESGFAPGKDDITSISIIQPPQPGDSPSGFLVGRASGDLRLLSVHHKTFGHAIQQFQPSETTEGLEQREIQSLHVHQKTDFFAAATKDQVLLYPLDRSGISNLDVSNCDNEASADLAGYTSPIDSLDLRKVSGSSSFTFIRSLKFVNQNVIAVGLTSSTAPLRYLSLTPAGIETYNAPNTNDWTPNDDRLGTVRALLPIHTSSMASGSGNTILTSWDDGTIRLQDLRTPSAFDRIYQNHFEPTTPINSLVSYGLERFVGGCARAPVLKIFDFRWSRGYDWTEVLPCSPDPPVPQPRPLTSVTKPLVVARPQCDHQRGFLCRWHALSKEDYYRPNCNIYLPKKAGIGTPVHSLAKGSDISSTLYVGLSGTVAEMSLRGGSGPSRRPSEPADAHPPSYSHHRVTANFIETGDGLHLDDISLSQRMPIIRAQSERRCNHNLPPSVTRRHRLDEWLQDVRDFSVLEGA